MEKYCVKCGRKFESVGREVICPSCKAQAAEDAKRAAVLKAKRASWTGQSVPVRISGRASTVIREYGKAHDVPFAAALDMLLQSTDFFQSSGRAWEDIVPYKSRRLKKSTDATDALQEVNQTALDVPQEVKPQEVKTASKPAKVARKATKTSKTSKK